jgi:hypothetical protein
LIDIVKKFVVASLLLALAPLAFAAPPSAEELVLTYKTQLKAVAAGDRTALAGTLDEETCRDVREVFSSYKSTPDEARLIQAITGMDQPTLAGLKPCEQTAQLTLGLAQLGKYAGSSGVPDKVSLLGIVQDGPNRVYGVFRSTVKTRNVEFTTEELVSFAKNGQEWKIGANSGLKGIVAALKAQKP